MTDWELGNDIMCNIVDRLHDLAGESVETHPEISLLLNSLALDFGPLVNRLMEEGVAENGMCTMRKEKAYRYFDGRSEKFSLKNKE